MPLLADDHLRRVGDFLHLFFPLLPLRRVVLRLASRQIIFFAVDEHDHVGILFDRSGFAEVGELRALVVALLHRARQLRQRDNRHVEFLGDRLQAPGDFGNLLHPVVDSLHAGRAHQLEIVDDEQTQVMGPLQTPGAGPQLGNGERRGVVDKQGRLVQLGHRGHDLVGEFIAADLAAAKPFGTDLAGFRQQAGGELFRRHLQTEKGGDRAFAARTAVAGGGAVGHVGGQCRFAHGGTSREDQQIRRMQAAELGVQVPEAGADADQTAVALERRLDHPGGFGDRRAERPEGVFLGAFLGQVVERGFRILDLFGRLIVDAGFVGAVDDLLAERNQFTALRQIEDDLAVVFGVDDRRRRGGQAGEVLRPADLRQALVAGEMVLQGNRVGDLAAFDHQDQRFVDARMQRFGEMLGPEELGDLAGGFIVDEDRAEQFLFRFDVVRRGPILRLGGVFEVGRGNRVGVNQRIAHGGRKISRRPREGAHYRFPRRRFVGIKPGTDC